MSLITEALSVPMVLGPTETIDTSAMDYYKTIQCICGEGETLDIQASNDNGDTWINVHRFSGTGIINVSVFASLIRVNVIKVDYNDETIISISANLILSLSTGSIEVPKDGALEPIDTSFMSAVKTVYCTGGGHEALAVEMSNDGNNWSLVTKLHAGHFKQINCFSQYLRARTLKADYNHITTFTFAGTILGSGPEGTAGTGGSGGSSIIFWGDQDWEAIKAQIPVVESGLGVIIDFNGAPCNSFYIDSPCNFDNVQFTCTGTSSFQPSLYFQEGAEIQGTSLRAKNIQMYANATVFEGLLFQLTLDGAGLIVNNSYTFAIVNYGVVMVELTNGGWTQGQSALNPVFLMNGNAFITIDARGGGNAYGYTAALGDDTSLNRAVQVDPTSFIEDNVFGSAVDFPVENPDVHGDAKYINVEAYENFAWPRTFRNSEDLQSNPKQMLNYLFTGLEGFDISYGETYLTQPGGFYPQNTRRYAVNVNLTVFVETNVNMYITYLNLRGKPDVLQITNANYEHGEYNLSNISFMANGDQIVAEIFGIGSLITAGVVVGDTLVISDDTSSNTGVNRSDSYTVMHIIDDYRVIIDPEHPFPAYFQDDTNQVNNYGNCHIEFLREEVAEPIFGGDGTLHTYGGPIEMFFQQSTYTGATNVVLSYGIKGV